MPTNPTRQVISVAIQQILREHVEEPFMVLREIGLQARLWCLLRAMLEPKVVMSKVVLKKGARFVHTGDFKTSRVHLEAKVGGSKKSDIVVLRADRMPQLTCWPGGPTRP
jgi:hypothetical protein